MKKMYSMKLNTLYKIPLILSGLLLMAPMAIAQSKSSPWTLQECINYALENNIDVRQQKLETELSASQLKSAKADWFPSVSGFSNFSHTSGRSVDPFTNEISNTSRNSSDMGLSANLTIFRGMQRKNIVERETYSLKADAENLEMIKDNISMEVASAYMQILFNKELLQVSENQLDVTHQQVERTEKLVSAGKLARSDLLEIEAQKAQERLQVVERRNRLNNSVLELTQLLELDSVGNFSIASPDMSINEDMQVLPDIKSVYKEATATLPHIKGAEYAVKAAEEQHQVAKGLYSPTVSLRANYYTGYSSTRNLYNATDTTLQPIGIVEDTGSPVVAPNPQFETETYPFMDQLKDNAQTAVQLSINIPIFSNLNNKTEVSRSKIMMHKAENQLEQRGNQLRKEIQSAHTDALAALEKFHATEKSVEANQEAFKFAKQRFNLGLINSVDYNTAKNNLANAESELLKAKYDFIFKRTILDFYRGQQLKFD